MTDAKTSPNASATEVAGHIAEARAAKLNHTAGPWQAQHEFDMNGACTIVGNIQDHDGDYGETRLTCTTICDINEDPDEWLANRALIIAAPDLLEALELIEVDLTAGNMPLRARITLALDRARAAIAKAKGE